MRCLVVQEALQERAPTKHRVLSPTGSWETADVLREPHKHLAR